MARVDLANQELLIYFHTACCPCVCSSVQFMLMIGDVLDLLLLLVSANANSILYRFVDLVYEGRRLSIAMVR